jgi:NAD(P)-dependent dehydrogenase (short-subunit alcohol dehydrogenase family)
MKDYKSIEGKVVIVTGGATGIGRAAVRTFAAHGAKVVFGSRREDKGQALADEVTASGGVAIFKKTDVTIENDVADLVALATEKFGKLHVMYNNAGRTYPNLPVHEYTSEDFDIISDIHYKSVFYGIKYAVPAMIATDSRACSIINTVSGSGLRGTEGLALYVSSKHAAIGLTKVAALDYARHDITVNAICPGVVDTDIFAGVPPEQLAIYGQMMPLGRIGSSEEIAALALFLASDQARFITGATIPIDAGQQAGDANPALVWQNPDPRTFG